MTDGFFSKKKFKSESNNDEQNFNNSKNEPIMPDIQLTNSSPILLPTEVLIEGNFKTKHPIKVESKFHGILLSKDKIIIESQSEIQGDIICSELIISGKLTGNIYCTGKVLAKNGCVITGKIFTKRFENDDNTNLNCIISVPDNTTIEQISTVLDDVDLNIKLSADPNLPQIVSQFVENLTSKSHVDEPKENNNVK